MPEPPADTAMGEGASSPEVPVHSETTDDSPLTTAQATDVRLRLLESEYASLLLEKRSLEAECETLKAAQSSDKHEKASRAARITQLEEALESERLAATRAEEQHTGLEAAVSQVRQEYADFQTRYASERAAWEEQAATQNLALQQVQAASSALETELAAARSELSEARGHARDLEEQTQTLQQALSDAEATREVLTACQQDLAWVREENEKLKTANEVLTGRLEQAQAALVEKTTLLQQAEQDLAAERESRAAEHEELEALRRELKENQAAVTQEGEQVDALRLELAQAREEQSRLAQALDQRNEYTQTLETDKARLKRERTTVAGQVRDLHTELAAAGLALEKLQAQNAEQSRKLAKLEAENKQLNAQLRANSPGDTVSLPVVQRPLTIPPAPAEENTASGDDKEGDRHSRVLKIVAAVIALVLALAAGYLAHLLLASTDEDKAMPAPEMPSVTATPHPRSTPSEAPSPAAPAVPAPSADTAPPAPPVGEGGSAPQGTDEQPAPQPDWQPLEPVEAPAPAPAPEPAPVPEPAYVTDLSANASSSGRSVTISANVSTTGAVPVSVYATVGGHSLSLGSQTVAGSGFFEASISLEPGTYTWTVSADGLVNSGTITVY
ncbi:hypothetical protein SC377_08095 [Actinotignum sp. SLA_B059]|uniref:hypothetical protein n=1 Tax=Actinotignum sp. SLA_B059 TaxID=3083287 RepID=UPI002A834298|nr:hypothetical protein [Actinotignum sp. SLA_B059]MDY5128102.1 hypothetical protein [Actinotignum sp. SLA_B059]